MNRLKKSDMNACTVQLWYNKQRVKKSGCVSLYVQLITRKESIELPLKIEWPLKAIDLKKRELVQRMPNDPDLLAFTSIVEREKAKYWDIIRRFLIKGVEFTLTDIIRESKIYASGTMICEFMEQSIRARQKAPKLRERIKASTAEIHKVGLSWLKNFLKGGDYPIAQIDADWLEAFADHMRPHMHENSVYVKIANVKSYLTYASNHRVAVNMDYKRFKVYSEEPDLDPIDEQEFGRLLALYDDIEKIGEHRPALRAFLFACFTGLRISDLKRFNSKWLCEGGFTFLPVKRRLSNHTPKPLFIPLIPIAEKFVKNIGDGDLGLPSEQEYNRQLKEIAVKAGISKRMTSHTARHTFGTNLALRNIPLTVIANLMGHKNTNTTMRYINIAERSKVKAMFALQEHYGI